MIAVGRLLRKPSDSISSRAIRRDASPGGGVKHGVVQDKLFLRGCSAAPLMVSGFFGRVLRTGRIGYWVYEGPEAPPAPLVELTARRMAAESWRHAAALAYVLDAFRSGTNGTRGREHTPRSDEAGG